MKRKRRKRSPPPLAYLFYFKQKEVMTNRHNPLDGMVQKSLDPRKLERKIREEINSQAVANTQEKSNNGN